MEKRKGDNYGYDNEIDGNTISVNKIKKTKHKIVNRRKEQE